MQQFFSEYILNIGDEVSLEKEIVYQLKKVLRANDGYKFRLVDKNHEIYLCELNNDKAKVIEYLNEHNELDANITAIISLVKNDKLDFMIQKLTELGVKRIVPYIANRSVVKPGKGTNKLDRLKKIAKEASEQSHRNMIPEITEYITFKDLDKYMSDVNIVAYEKETTSLSTLTNIKSISFIIGPEGGFEIQEINSIIEKGFASVSLGKRILRAETAAIYIASLIVGNNQ